MELKDLVHVFDEVLNQVHKETITEDTEFKDLDSWSSLSAFELTAKINDEFGIKLRGLQIRKCATIKELFELISK